MNGNRLVGRDFCGAEEGVMRNRIVLALVIAVNGGCTTTSVRDHAVNQALSVADMRYQEVLDNLAIVAHNTGRLPSFGYTTAASRT